MHSTFQGLVTGIHWGIGYGLGAMIGGVMYAGIGARMCFEIGAVLPSLSMTLLLLPGFRRWYVARCCPRRGVRTRRSTEAITDAEYELISKVDSHAGRLQYFLGGSGHPVDRARLYRAPGGVVSRKPTGELPKPDVEECGEVPSMSIRELMNSLRER